MARDCISRSLSGVKDSSRSTTETQHVRLTEIFYPLKVKSFHKPVVSQTNHVIFSFHVAVSAAYNDNYSLH